MECDICGKKGDVPAHCITCARSAIEVPRIELAKVLIERDAIGKHVQAVIQGSEDKASQHVSLKDSRGGFLVDRHECTKNIDLGRIKAETFEHEERIRLITDQADLLRKQMEATRRELEEKRRNNARRKSDMSSATYGIESRRANELDKVQQNVKRMDYKSDKVHHETMERRTAMCTTAARLAGLRITRRRTKDGGIKEVYTIGPGTRLRIYDLQHINDAPPDSLSASLGAVAQLLVRVSAYLGVRLPAEITLPHSDYPQPTIFPPSSSYQGKKVPFPGSTPSHSSSTSPEASRTLDHRGPLPKPRPLFVDRPLAHLTDDDHPAYLLFVEGVSYLAYNVAWLCRTQGLKDEFNSWEDVCPIGQNLFRLLLSQGNRTPPRPENPLDRDMVPGKANSKTPPRSTAGFGELSHATCHSFLNTAENQQYMSGWKLTPMKIIDELKAHLYAEQQTQEWDVVDEKDTEDMDKPLVEDPVVVGDKRRDGLGLDDGRSYLTSTTTGTKVKGSVDEGNGALTGDEKRKGNSGWMKVKSRSEDIVRQATPE
ncbi:hypothetical protein P154DRAFT_493602 [Amniculicola lignicola CBS 123094]|uniref:Autophagy-related protein 14 n=1 Tax=Amniculicola lignicola CBS 123094 TaxID=1392246 RepID=A0A6A5WDI7_9PLEO|nr:hypothetical protein P154DRAFT_493602 [Amniculicola lignicola CBS 123094]